jgi:hypothetical protein
MLCVCLGDRWPIQCMMVNEVERGIYNVGFFCFLYGQFINLVICNDACVGSDFVDDNIVVRSF